MIYLDNAATTYPKPESVYSFVDSVQRSMAFNSGRGSYKKAQKSNAIIEDTRNKLAELFKCTAQNVVLSPSATIAMNQLLYGLNLTRRTVYISPFEHNAVVRVLHALSEEYDVKIEILPFDSITQQLDETEMNNRFAINHPDLVVLNHISNVTGVITPVDIIFNSAKEYGALTILDASQSAGLLDIDLRKLKCDYIVFAGHKSLYGHIGIGGFVINNNLNSLKKMLCGGTGSDSLNPEMPSLMPDKYEPASHNIIAISSLNASLEWIKEIGIEKIRDHKKRLTKYALECLKTINEIKIYAPDKLENHISVISFTHKEYKPHELAEILDEDFDIAVRCGYHCAPYVHKLIGTDKTEGTVRLSFSYFNTEEHIDALVNALQEIE